MICRETIMETDDLWVCLLLNQRCHPVGEFWPGSLSSNDLFSCCLSYALPLRTVSHPSLKAVSTLGRRVCMKRQESVKQKKTAFITFVIFILRRNGAKRECCCPSFGGATRTCPGGSG